MHKIDGPALVECLRGCQRNRITHQQTLFSLATKIQFQKTVNPVNKLVIPGILACKGPEKTA